MAAGPVTVLDVALPKLSGDFDLGADAFKVALCGASQELDAGFTGGSGDALYSDLTDEVVGDGYTAGGADLNNVSWTLVGSEAVFAADPSTWVGAVFTAKYAVIYRPAGAGEILAIVDLDVGGSGRAVSGTDFILNWTSDLFVLRRAAS